MKYKISILIAVLCIFTVKAQEMAGLEVDQLRKLQMVQMAITGLYVDSVDQGKLCEDAIKGMLEALDPHSAYSNAEETKKLNEPLEGNFDGIGVQFNVLEDTLVVMQPMRKGPSEKVGILAGDRIIRVNGVPIAGVKMDRSDMMKKLRGPKGTQVLLSVVRRNVADTLQFLVVRDKIPVNTLDAAYMLTQQIGYIRLDRCGATSGKEVDEAVSMLQKQGMKSLIFDLTANGGGYLESAFDIANIFLEKDAHVVYTEGRTQPRQSYMARGGGRFQKGNVIILVDEYTASAAEIIAGAVQDHDRGTIVGRRTFGKGLVQRPIPLPDGSMIRLTTAHYYTPSGRCIQKTYLKGQKRDYDLELLNRFHHGELVNIDSIHLDSTKVYSTLRKRRTVYGGGGIMPDVFVPLDTSTYTKFYTALRRGNYINDISLKYIDRNRSELQKKAANFSDFIDKYDVPQDLVDSVLAAAACKNITPRDSLELEKTLPDLRFTLKSLIIYDIFDRNEYFMFINRRNDILSRALRELSLDNER